MRTLPVVLCLLLTILTARAENLLKNPSYEEAGSSDDTAEGWSRWGDWMNRETAWSPTHEGRCLVGYHHWEVTSENSSGIWQDVTGVKPGQKFKFSVFLTADKPDSGNSAQKVELRLEAIRQGHEVTIESTSVPVATLQQDPGWHEFSVSGTTPESNIRVLVVVTPAASSRGGAVKVDDAKLEAVK